MTRPRRPKSDDAGTRTLNAVLRWRLRWTLARMPADQVAALRFLPALLQASFATPPLRGEAPGVTRLKFRRRWSTLARTFGLPPPSSMQRAKAAIEALILVPRAESIEVLALVANELPGPARVRAQERFAVAKTALGAAGRTIELKLVDLQSIDEETFQSILTLGSLLAGSPPPIFFTATHPASKMTLPIAARLAERAPTPLSALALMMLLGSHEPSPLEAMRKGIADKCTTRQLADPSFFCARWAAQETGREVLLMTALRWSKIAPASSSDGLSPKDILHAGRELTLACARAIHHLPIAASKGLRLRLRRDVIGLGVPRALLPALAQCKIKLSVAPIQAGAAFEIRNTDGAVFGRGRSGIQARVRALALATAANLPTESKLAVRLAKSASVATLHVIVETYEVPGPPFDPLNRGPERTIGLLGATAMLMRPDARPTGFQLTAEEAVMRLCNDALAGRETEVVPQLPEGQPAAARLARVVALVQKKSAAPTVIEAGGRVLFERHHRIRRVALRQFARRPMICSIDPESFDLSLSPERGARNSGAFAIPGAIACRVFQCDFDPNLATVLSHDDRGRLLREEVQLSRLEDHLREGQEILRGCVPPAPLASRLADGMEMLLLRHRRPVSALAVVLGGELPFGLWAEISGERILLSRPGGWASAAQAILSWLPVGEEPRLRITRAEITERGAPACGISRLYTRALVVRRLELHLKKQLALIDR